MFKVLILQAMHSLSDERCEYLIKDRLSFMRFLGISVADAVPDANTIWTFREGLKRAGAVDVLFRRFDELLRASGFLAMSGQIVDATIVAAPKQRNTQEEKQALRDGRIPEEWKDKPAKLAQKEDVLDRDNTASEVWADTAYRSVKNEAMLARRGFISRIHRKKPKGKTMPERTRLANAQKSKVRSAIEHVFAHQKGLLNLTIRTIGLARARVKIGLANLAYNMRRFIWLRTKYVPA
jgi:IS5 family transposase